MSALLPVEEAVRRVLDGVEPVGVETVPIADAEGCVLAAPLVARRTQPPFDVSAMDGYAVRAADLAAPGARLRVIGQAPAGHAFAGTVGRGETVRIFTGAFLPAGADAVLLQEDAAGVGEDVVTARETLAAGRHVRPRGLDFHDGQTMLPAGARLGMRQVALAAATNHATLAVRRRPRVAIIATGDELSLPGESVAEDRIVASNSFGIAALVKAAGGEPIDLGIVADDRDALATTIDRALAHDIDVLVTLGGASVGDHDFAMEVLAGRGLRAGFWRIAMRPGKPLIFGHIGATRVLGLPGNPVSSLVCALLFLRPLVEALLGMPASDATVAAVLGARMAANDHRQDYVRARLGESEDGKRTATPFPRQDSSMLSVFTEADCLIVRPPNAPPALAGDPCRILPLP